MKTALALLAITTSAVLGQGPLAPPAAPAPTMKTLAQIEARTPLGGNATDDVSIGASGSYYLVSNVRSVRISASDVTLDLNGFSVIQTQDTDGIGIYDGAPRSNVTIRNGSVVGPGTWTQGATPTQGAIAGSTRNGIVTYGRSSGTITGQNLRIEQITVRGFGIGMGIGGFDEFDGSRDSITNCQVRDFGTYGIRANFATIRDTIVHSGSGNAFEVSLSTLGNCVTERATGNGINGSTNSVRGFVARFIGGHGIYSPSSTITSANASGCGGAGIYCDNSSLSQCFAQNNGDDGIRAVASVLSDCRAFGNDTNPSPYIASGIYWAGGKIANSLADTAVPAIP